MKLYLLLMLILLPGVMANVTEFDSKSKVVEGYNGYVPFWQKITDLFSSYDRQCTPSFSNYDYCYEYAHEYCEGGSCITAEVRMETGPLKQENGIYYFEYQVNADDCYLSSGATAEEAWNKVSCDENGCTGGTETLDSVGRIYVTSRPGESFVGAKSITCWDRDTKSNGLWSWAYASVAKTITISSPLCTSFTYSDWSTCNNGIQTRTLVSSNPLNCVGGNPILSQSCTVPVIPITDSEIKAEAIKWRNNQITREQFSQLVQLWMNNKGRVYTTL